MTPRARDEEQQADDVVDEDLLSSWSFTLPEDRIARRPPARRTDARLLVLSRDGTLAHRHIPDLVELLHAGDCLVVNDTTVVPARLSAHKAGSGGHVELLLVRADDGRSGVDDDAYGRVAAQAPGVDWIVLLNASKKPKPGARLVLSSGTLGVGDVMFATVLGPVDGEPGAWRVRFEGDVLAWAALHGEVPLPPYMERAPDDDDTTRYQTVFRDPSHAGSSAAPTAGLHFDDALLARLRDKGVAIARVTLHVGPGTFLPVHSERLSQHAMHAEPWWLSSETAAILNATRARGGRIVAVGTTSVRVLESARVGRADDAPFVAGSGLTRIFIKPGHRVTSIDALVTNFHLPESTLLVLVGTLVGRARLLDAYATAVDSGYRFYSYGDACFVEVTRPESPS